MANITNTGTTGYPGVLDTRTALTDGATGDQIVANHPNGLGAAVIAVETTLGVNPQGSVADVVTRLGVSQNNDGTIRSSVIAQGTGASVAYSSGVFTVSFSGDGPNFLQNVSLRIDINAPVANQFRINLLQADASTPTTANPCRIAFAPATLSSGIYNTRTATTTTTLVVTGGSTLGMINNELGRLYIGLIDNNTVPELCVWNSKVLMNVSTTTVTRVAQLWRPSETELHSTTAEGGAGGADSAATLYSTIARTNVPVRIIGYLDIQTGSTAGNWSNTPHAVRLVGPGVKTTGEVIQRVATQTMTAMTTTTVTPVDATIPQISEGLPVLWATMTSSNVVNPIQLDHIGLYANSGATGYTVAHPHRNSEVNALGCAMVFYSTANSAETLMLSMMIATTTSGATGYYLVSGPNNNTMTVNGEAGSTLFTGANLTTFTVTEICA